MAIPIIPVNADIQAGDDPVAHRHFGQVDLQCAAAAAGDLCAAQCELVVPVRVKTHSAGIGVDAQCRAGDLIVQRYGIVHCGLFLLEGLCSRLAVLHQRHRTIRQTFQRLFCCLGDQLRIRGGIVFPVVDSLDAVAIVKTQSRHDGIARGQRVLLIGRNRKGIGALAGKYLTGEVFPPLIVSRLGLVGPTSSDADAAPVISIVIPVVAGDLDRNGGGIRGERGFYDLEDVFFVCIADGVDVLSRPSAVIGQYHGQLFPGSQGGQAGKGDRLTNRGICNAGDGIRRVCLIVLSYPAQQRTVQRRGRIRRMLHPRGNRELGTLIRQLTFDEDLKWGIGRSYGHAFRYVIGVPTVGRLPRYSIEHFSRSGRLCQRDSILAHLQAGGIEISRIQRLVVITEYRIRNLCSGVQLDHLQHTGGRHAGQVDGHLSGQTVHTACHRHDGRLFLRRHRHQLGGIVFGSGPAAVPDDRHQLLPGGGGCGERQMVLSGS